MDLSGTQALGIYELAEIIVVDEYKNLIFAAFQIVVTIFKVVNND